MEIALSAAIRVFCGEEENEGEVVGGLKSLLPFDMEKEKIAIQKQTAFGFSDNKIKVFEVTLAKKRHAKAFLESMLAKISGTDRQMLLRQLDSRVDDNANFFVRFDKESLAKNGDLLVTDSGNCYHVRIKIAAYPSTKKAAAWIMEGVLKTKTI